MKTTESDNTKIFVSFEGLLAMELHAEKFSTLSRKKRVKSILGGKNASLLRGNGLDFEEVRKYVIGDDIRHIDWKVTARKNKTHLSVYSEEKDKPVFVIVDQSSSMFFGSVYKTKSVIAAELAALTVYRVLKDGDRVGGLVFNDHKISSFQPVRNRNNIYEFFQALVKYNRQLPGTVNRKEDDEMLEAIIQQAKKNITHDFLVVVISDFKRYSKRLIEELASISQHNDVILAKVFDPFERDIPPLNYVVSDTREQLSVKGNKANLVKDFKEDFDMSLQNFTDTMLTFGIPLFTIDTKADVHTQLHTVLLKRNHI